MRIVVLNRGLLERKLKDRADKKKRGEEEEGGRKQGKVKRD